MKILVTGSCGFIGYHLCKRLIKDSHEIIGIDNFNPYYDVTLKEDRRSDLLKENVDIIRGDILDNSLYLKLPKFDIIIHLAAQAGVRYSVINPYTYIQNNIVGFHNVIHFAKEANVKKFIYASTSSVYGSNIPPWSEEMTLKGFPSLYAASKASNEEIAESYFQMFGLKCIGLRFFTVYGPWGRPDMAVWKWTEAILNNKPVDIYNFGKMERSWTYIDDIISGIISSLYLEVFDHERFNLGDDNSINIEYALDYISSYLKIIPKKNYLPIQIGDAIKTGADLTKSRRILGFEPTTKFEEGVVKFIDWYEIYTKKLRS